MNKRPLQLDLISLITSNVQSSTLRQLRQLENKKLCESLRILTGENPDLSQTLKQRYRL